LRSCSVAWDPLGEGEWISSKGLRQLSPKLSFLKALPYSAEEQRTEALKRVHKMSVQGVQPKLSAILKVKEGTFEVVDQYGRYILKPPHVIYKNVPENEALTMSMAACYGCKTPRHGLVQGKDLSYTYFVKRFDRIGRKEKVAQEDFAQLSGRHRHTKYDSSMEQVINVINKYCTFPALERLKLFRLTLFCFVVGNEDMHLKNFSLITRDKKIELSPVYDLLNTSIILENVQEELALPVRGRKRNLSKKDLIHYFGKERCELSEVSIDRSLQDLIKVYPKWIKMIRTSYLNIEHQEAYLDLLDVRFQRLELVIH
jgi:serine/threonine-protein kinase HipA